MTRTNLLSGLCLALLFATLAFAQEDKKETAKFVGARSCKACHMTKKSGAAYKIWQKSKHAQAYATLGSEEAKAIAKERGIEDAQKSEECLPCHVAAFGSEAAQLGPKYKQEDGVSCEACHGAGEKYKSKKVMEGTYAGTIDPATVGLIKPTEKDCLRCHNDKSPTYKEFTYKERYAKIAHEIPEKASN